MEIKFMWMEVCILFLLGVFIIGCSSKEVPANTKNPPIEIKYEQIRKCYVHKDYVSCELSSENTYYVTTDTQRKVLAEKTTWDCTMWKEGNCLNQT